MTYGHEANFFFSKLSIAILRNVNFSEGNTVIQAVLNEFTSVGRR